MVYINREFQYNFLYYRRNSLTILNKYQEIYIKSNNTVNLRDLKGTIKMCSVFEKFSAKSRKLI